MPEETKNHPRLTVIKGGKISEQEFIRLSPDEKVEALRQQPARKRLDFLLADPEGQKLTASLLPQELYWLVREIGEHDSLPLFDLVSPEQYTFMLDMELWDKWSLSTEKAMTWLQHLVESGEDSILRQVRHLEFELLLLLLKRQVEVAGGLGDLINDDQRLAEWDHTFDNIFYLTFLEPQNARLIGSFLEAIYRNDHHLYLSIMTGIQAELESELEEVCWQFRTGRLEQEGFPSLDEALSIYAWSDPDRFVLSGDKLLQPVEEENNTVPQPVPVGDLLLQRALKRVNSPHLLLELNYLVNSALVAEETAFDDKEGIELVCRRVYGYLNISLEYLAGFDEEKAASILTRERLARLFRLGYSLAAGLHKRCEKCSSDNYAVNKVLLGLKSKRPSFYRGLDTDRTDGYREFRSMGDIRIIEEFLRTLEV